ncbi:MAG: sulfatase-like hydrolase/transferase [Chitinophagaceae bacterium]
MIARFRQKNTYSVLYYFVLIFIVASFLVRLVLLFFSIRKADLGLLALCRIFGEGLLFDIGVASFFVAPYSLYLLILPAKWNNSIINRIITYVAFTLAVLILMFSFFAEFTFWQEFESRFNFIAVDYLIYTFEVINNINESYPLPLLIGGMLIITLGVVLIFKKRKIFFASFHGSFKFLTRLVISSAIILIALMYAAVVDNSFAETSANRYQNELAKAGIYSFFSAFKSNELNYVEFYRQVDNGKAFAIVRDQLKDSGTVFNKDSLSIKRNISALVNNVTKPNVIMITIESLSADFMTHFGNTQALTPVLDSMANISTLFTNMYATGSRTVRGMEALSLGIPPTPGNSIVRRSDNDNLTTIGHIFQQQEYQTGFFYGGDGYFDNMNRYFSNNDFIVTDRGRNILKADKLKGLRNIIPDSLVHFENAWGICDEDLYDAVIRDADETFKKGKLFYDFVMTTSNHRPFTYPPGKIDILSGTGREGAVKYTDYAIGQFLKKIKDKPWFRNTVIIFVADHCSNSAGKNEIDITKYHIPAIIYNPRDTVGGIIEKMCSQIDLYPTLLSTWNWNYTSNLYGQNVLSTSYKPRILLGTYQKLAYMRNDSLVILSPQQKVETYKYRKDTNEQIPMPEVEEVVAEAIANYQTAYYLFKSGGLKK